jgi:hypothetical protein
VSAIKLTNFGGIIPRTSPRLVGDNIAQKAINCRLSNGELIPFNKPKVVATVSKAFPFKTIYRATESGDYHWLAFDADTDVIKAPLYGKAKWCWTGATEPRIAELAGLKVDTFYTLGTPKPVTALTATPTGGVASNIERYYTYTFIAKWSDVEFEGAMAPLTAPITGKPDGSWAITGMDATPISSGTVTGAYSAPDTAFTSAVPHWLRVGEEVVISSVTMKVTAVTSPLIFKVAGDYAAATTWARKAPFPGTITKNLYRSTGTTGQFQLVAENITGTTYTDTLTDGQIPGDELISSDWDMPPVGLQGMCALPSGALCGFLGNKVFFSEPNQPQAWPSNYALISDYPVTAVASFGTGVFAATDSRPFIITGTEPGQMYGQAWEEVLPCYSKRSMVSLGDLVLYSSHVGIIAVNAAGAQMWTQAYFTEYEWKKLKPESIVTAFAARRLYAHYDTGDFERTLIFNLMGDHPYLTETSFEAEALYADATTGELYFSSGNQIFEHDPADGYPMSQEWMSKEIDLPRPTNLGAAKVNFDLAIDPALQAEIEAQAAAVLAFNTPLLATGNVYGAWNMKPWGGAGAVSINDSILKTPVELPPGNEVTFQLFKGTPTGEMALVAARTVSDSKPFHLPSGYKADSVAVHVISQCAIKSVELGATKAALAGA